MSVNRGMVDVTIMKPRRTRSLMWYVDWLIVAGVIGVVITLALINYSLV